MKTVLLALLFGSAFLAAARAQQLTNADQVLNAYFKAIGGKDDLLRIKDLTWKSISPNNGVPFLTLAQYKPPLKQVVTSSAPDGKVAFKFVCDGKDISMAIGNNTPKLSRSAMDKMMLTLLLMPELYLADYGVKTTLAGQETVEGKDAYKLTHTMPDGSTWYTYYDTQTGLKVKVYVPGQTLGEVNYYSDYRQVNGIKLPFILRPGQGTLKIESYLMNTGLSDGNFSLP